MIFGILSHDSYIKGSAGSNPGNRLDTELAVREIAMKSLRQSPYSVESHSYPYTNNVTSIIFGVKTSLVNCH